MRRRASQTFLFATFVGALACESVHSYASVENRSAMALRDARFEFAENPPVVVDLPAIAPGASITVSVPAGLGETGVKFAGTVGDADVSSECGYLESGGNYHARVVVVGPTEAICNVELDSY